MKLPAPLGWDQGVARKGGYDGKFIVGLMTSGSYGLPSCAVPPRPSEELRVFTTEAAAKAAGLRACRLCRPDQFYRGNGAGLAVFQDLASQVAAAPEQFVTTSDLARHAGLTAATLDDLLRDHAHVMPAQWLRRVRVQCAARRLLHSARSISAVGSESGFQSNATFHRQFSRHMRMTVEAYRALDASRGFHVQLPAGYRRNEILAYQARDPESLSERSDGNRIWKALNTDDGPVVLELALGVGQASVRIHARRKIGRDSLAKLHDDALRILGLVNEVTQFERSHAALVNPRRGLRLPLLPSGFEALCWAIIGQQINIRFASALRREIVSLAGEKIHGMRAHPTAEALATIDASTLTARRYSRSKARYLVGAAQAVATGTLEIENLAQGSAIAAESALLAQHGIGTWTARYVLMRSGFADAAPVGDSALATALQQLHRLPERPDAEGTARLMSRFAPHRSLATMHLWTRLREGP
jgi:AraC family transcriptional regulator of adaptative response / DNA-3-methyladenine glycosylase II